MSSFCFSISAIDSSDVPTALIYFETSIEMRKKDRHRIRAL